MRKWLFLWLFVILSVGWKAHAIAHFAMVIPSDTMVMQGEPREVKVTLSFSHPFQGEGMDLEKPFQFGVVMGRW
jgi:cobalt/nickel transport protein